MEVNRTDRVDNRMDVREEMKDGKLGDFKTFTKSYNSISSPLHNTRVPDEKRRELCGRIAGIIQELLNLPTLTDTDRRLLNLSSALAFLLSGGR
jgi:hypothetical protein